MMIFIQQNTVWPIITGSFHPIIAVIAPVERSQGNSLNRIDEVSVHMKRKDEVSAKDIIKINTEPFA